VSINYKVLLVTVLVLIVAGGMEEYWQIETIFDKHVVKDIADWLRHLS